MTWPWRSPEATRRALTDKARVLHPDDLNLRLREIAYRRLLARVFATQPDQWVVKGGVALLLRLDPNRTSNDIDLAYVGQAGEHAVALKALVEAAAHDLGDFFEFEIGRDEVQEVDPDHPLERALNVPVKARIGEALFAQFNIDLALPREASDVKFERISAPITLTGVAEVDKIEDVAVLDLPSQVADKLCAVFEMHPNGQHSSRTRDLADIAMIAQQKDLDGDAVIARLRREQERRLTAGTLVDPLPQQFALSDAQIQDWSSRWKKATRNAPVTFEDAQAIVATFADPVLDGSAAGMTWSAVGQTWT